MADDATYMRRALQLARNGALDASPNPMVGAVIVSPSGDIIGEGWHRRCGEGHAEVNAVASVADEALLREATMYVTLEPCSHYGKTPPCADLIVSKGIPRVVVACLDPFEKVSGRGVAWLRDAGVDVTIGVLKEEARRLNRKFFTAHQWRRPYVTLKWAESADGFIDGKISNALTATAVHKLRATHDAILIGSGTALADRPGLDTRFFAGKSPRKYVLDRRGRVDMPSATVINSDKPLEEMLRGLYADGVTSLLVEGGAQIHKAFIEAGLWDAIRVEKGTEELCGAVRAPEVPAEARLEEETLLGGHRILTFTNQSAD